MAFKRRTKGGSSGDRKTTTLHNDGTGFTRSYSSSSTGKQKTGSGGTRSTTTTLNDGTIRKTITRHGANGLISRKSYTVGAPTPKNSFKPLLSKKKSKSSSSASRSVPAPRGPKNIYRKSKSGNSSVNPIAGLGAILLIAGIYYLFVYWKIVAALLIAVVICWVIVAYSKRAERKKIENEFTDYDEIFAEQIEQLDEDATKKPELVSISRQQKKDDDGSVLQGFLGLIIFCVLIYKIVHWLG
jgi:hypothetical protein